MDIKIKDLSKIYSGQRLPALDRINLNVGSGIFGLLGQNGSGKTTLLRIMASLILPTSGFVSVAGHRSDNERSRRKIRSMIGYLPQELTLYENLSAWEFLNFMAVLKGVKSKQVREEQIKFALEVTGLVTNAHRLMRTFSGGMKRRVGIAQALLNNPKVLIVDEPTVGLDPQERVRFRNVLSGLARDRLIIMSTHIIEDIAQTCRQIGILHHGKLIYKGDTQDLLKIAGGKVWDANLPFGSAIDQFTISFSSTNANGINVHIISDSCPFDGAEPVEPTLEEAYLWITQKQGVV